MADTRLPPPANRANAVPNNAMPNVVPIFRDMVFEPELLQTMGEAHERACQQLNRADEFAKETVAQRIIFLAMAGERDAAVLCDRALTARQIW